MYWRRKKIKGKKILKTNTTKKNTANANGGNVKAKWYKQLKVLQQSSTETECEDNI